VTMDKLREDGSARAEATAIHPELRLLFLRHRWSRHGDP
jgi:hypothetical protein